MRRPVLRLLAFAAAARSAAFAVQAFALVALGLPACQVDGEVTGPFACAKDLRCPTGFACVAGFCAQSEEQLPPMACATTDQLSTTFDGAMLPSWTENPYLRNGGAVTVSGGELVMTIPANTNDARAQINSYAAHDLRGKTLELEVPQVAGFTTEVGLLDPSDAEVYFGVTEGDMFVYSKGRFLNRRPYAAIADRWWRARTEGQDVIVETSPDRATWALLGRDTAPINLAWVRLELSLQGQYNNTSPAGTARWSVINPDVDATVTWCKIASFAETFGDNALPPTTGWYGRGCDVTESGGQLRLSASEHDTNCVAYTNRPFDARDSTLAMPVFPSPSPGTTRLGYTDFGNRNVLSIEANDRLRFYVEADDNEVFNANVPRDDAQQKFWRIAIAGAQIRFETSADSVTWVTQQQTNAPTFDASGLFLERNMYVDRTGSLPVTAAFGEHPVNDAWEPPRLPETTRPRDQTISRLGAGGMAEVFLIRRTGPGGFEKFLALKRIRAGLDAAMFAPMLLDEARLVAALQHPNIVQVHDAGADDDGLWFLMEYVHGRSLGALIGRAIDRGVQVPLECAAYLIACVGRALHYAHHAESAQQERLGVIHRDVSPGNILVGFDGVVKLADFGIARANQRHAETQDGTFKGKYGYAAPEQCRGESLDGASDVFSLGIVLHELLSSRHLFSSDAPLATVEAVLHAPIPSLCELRDDVPAEVDALVRRMLERDRANRASSGAEIANELDGIAHRLGLPATRERMAELMTQLFTSTEMRLQVPAAAPGESLHTPLRAPVLGTPVRPSGSHASQHSAVTAALVEPGSAAGRRLAQSSQPGGEPRNAPGSAIGSQVGAPTSASHVATVAPQPSRDPHPSRRASAFSRIAVTALVGGLSAVGVTLLLREPARPAPPPTPAPAPAVRAPAPVEPVAPTPAAVDPAPAAAAAPAAGSTTPTLDKAGTGTVRRPTKAPRPSHGKPTSSDKRPDAPRSAKKKPGGGESLLERDW